MFEEVTEEDDYNDLMPVKRTTLQCREQPVVLEKKDVYKVRREFCYGQDFFCETFVWTDELIHEKKKIHMTIEGVYEHGLLLSFYHRNWKGLMKCTRWISYVEILMARLAGRTPLADVGLHSK